MCRFIDLTFERCIEQVWPMPNDINVHTHTHTHRAQMWMGKYGLTLQAQDPRGAFPGISKSFWQLLEVPRTFYNFVPTLRNCSFSGPR